MQACKHTTWLSLHGTEQIRLCQSSALASVVANLDDAATKWPSVVLLVGHSAQCTQLRMFLSKMKRNDGPDATPCVRLQVDPDTSFSNFPTLFACSQIPNKVVLAQEPVRNAPCHYNTFREAPWLGTDPVEAIEDLHRRLILPLADVICLFAPDRDGLQSVANRIVSWSAAERHTLWHPRVLVVCAATETRSSAEVLAVLVERVKSLAPFIDVAILSQISVHTVGRRAQTLKDRIRIETDLVRNARIQTHSLFSAAHLDRLFHHACDQFVNTEKHSFDPVAASRLHRPVSKDLGPCIADALSDVDSWEELTQSAVPFVAECLLLDNYSPDVHGLLPLSSQEFRWLILGQVSIPRTFSVATTGKLALLAYLTSVSTRTAMPIRSFCFGLSLSS